MADSQYTYNLVYYPYEVARVRLPMGLPAGGVVRLINSFFHNAAVGLRNPLLSATLCASIQSLCS
jgi:hypothetical protein